MLLRIHVSKLNVAVVQQNMDSFNRCFARYFNWSQNMRTLRDVRPDVASIASMVKKMLKALEKHLPDFAFREVRDDLVKLRQLGRIMTGPVALCCECEPLVFEELNVGKMYALLEVSPSASNEDLRHAVTQESA